MSFVCIVCAYVICVCVWVFISLVAISSLEVSPLKMQFLHILLFNNTSWLRFRYSDRI